MRLRDTLGRHLRDTRLALDISQREVAAVAGISRSHLVKVERGDVNVTLDMAERLAMALGIELELQARPPILVGGSRQRDLVHARCSAYVDRRLRLAGWTTAREVELAYGRFRGWIDILAHHAGLRTVIVVEIKTRLEDLGAIERQIAWYERSGLDVSVRLGWHASRTEAWLLALASDEVERTIALNRDLLDRSFPLRAPQMLLRLGGTGASPAGRGLGLVNPTSKRRAWIMRSRVDGRRSGVPFLNYADAARRLVANEATAFTSMNTPQIFERGQKRDLTVLARTGRGPR